MRRRARPPWRDDSRVKTSQNKATQRFDVVRVAILYVTLSGAWLWEHLGSQPETAHHLCYLSVSLPVQSASCSLTVAKKKNIYFWSQFVPFPLHLMWHVLMCGKKTILAGVWEGCEAEEQAAPRGLRALTTRQVALIPQWWRLWPPGGSALDFSCFLFAEEENA